MFVTKEILEDSKTPDCFRKLFQLETSTHTSNFDDFPKFSIKYHSSIMASGGKCNTKVAMGGNQTVGSSTKNRNLMKNSKISSGTPMGGLPVKSLNTWWKEYDAKNRKGKKLTFKEEHEDNNCLIDPTEEGEEESEGTKESEETPQARYFNQGRGGGNQLTKEGEEDMFEGEDPKAEAATFLKERYDRDVNVASSAPEDEEEEDHGGTSASNSCCRVTLSSSVVGVQNTSPYSRNHGGSQQVPTAKNLGELATPTEANIFTRPLIQKVRWVSLEGNIRYVKQLAEAQRVEELWEELESLYTELEEERSKVGWSNVQLEQARVELENSKRKHEETLEESKLQLEKAFEERQVLVANPRVETLDKKLVKLRGTTIEFSHLMEVEATASEPPAVVMTLTVDILIP
eukprot:Gb_40589 [translate_table: standard]